MRPVLPRLSTRFICAPNQKKKNASDHVWSLSSRSIYSAGICRNDGIIKLDCSQIWENSSVRTGTLLTAEHRLHLCSLLALHSLHLQEGDFKMQTFCNLQINSRQGPPCCGLSHIFPPHLSVCFHPARPLSVPQVPPTPPCSHLQTTLHAARTLLLHPLLLGAFFRVQHKCNFQELPM